MYGCESWTIKKAEYRRIDAFELRCWRRLLRVPWTARRSNQSILKEISPGCSLEGLMLKLKEKGDDRGWDCWMASPTQWMWIWASLRSWWWTGRPEVLWFMGSQRVGHNGATSLSFTFFLSCPLSWWWHPTTLCHPLLLPPSISLSIRVFSHESALHIRWPKCWSFSFSISSSNEHSGLTSIRMDWLDLLAVQGTLKSLLQHHSSKASILRCSAFFILQLSHPYMTTGKIIALTRWTFVGKVMSLLFNILSRLVITFLPRSKHLLISWLQSPSAVILEP